MVPVESHPADTPVSDAIRGLLTDTFVFTKNIFAGLASGETVAGNFVGRDIQDRMIEFDLADATAHAGSHRHVLVNFLVTRKASNVERMSQI